MDGEPPLLHRQACCAPASGGSRFHQALTGASSREGKGFRNPRSLIALGLSGGRSRSCKPQRVDLSGIDADANTVGDDAFSFIGAAAFSGTAGELRYVQGAILSMVYADVDGDGVEDFAIDFTGSLALVEDQFVL